MDHLERRLIFNRLFQVVHEMLLWMAAVTRLSYEEINILVYFLVIPAIYCALLDRIFKRPIFLPLLLALATVTLIAVPSFSNFSDWLFDESVAFPNGFTVIGWNYTIASVMLCVVFPGLVFAVLVFLAFPKFYRRHFPTLARLLSRPLPPRH